MNRFRIRLSWLVLIAVLLAASSACFAAESAALPPDQWLASYVNAPDASFKWEKGPVKESATGSVSDIVLTSQTWRGIVWQHLLRITKPAQVTHPGWVVLFISGGSGAPKPGAPQGEDMVGQMLGPAAGVPVAEGDYQIRDRRA